MASANRTSESEEGPSVERSAASVQKPCLLDCNSYTEVWVTCVVERGVYYVQPITKDAEMSEFFLLIQEEAINAATVSSSPVIGALCFAFCFGEWCRAKIQSVTPTIQVQLIDWGDIIESTPETLKEMTAKCKKKRPCISKIKLAESASECCFATDVYGTLKVKPLRFEDDCWIVAAEEDAVPSTSMTLAEKFICPICMDTIKDVHICPHCSKPFCYECILSWLSKQQLGRCPHCRAVMRLEEMVKCRWIEDLIEEFDALQAVSNVPSKAEDFQYERCSEHDEKLSVYCGTCKECVCHQCALWGDSHSGHSFEPLDKAYEQHWSQMKEVAAELQQHQSKLQSLVEEVDRNEECVRVAKDKRVDKIMNAVHSMLDQLDAELKDKLSTLMDQKGLLTANFRWIEALLLKIEDQSPSRSKLELVNQSREFYEKVDQIRKTMAGFITVPVSADFQSGSVFDSPTWTAAVSPFGSSAVTSSGASGAESSLQFGDVITTPQPSTGSGNMPAAQQPQTGLTDRQLSGNIASSACSTKESSDRQQRQQKTNETFARLQNTANNILAEPITDDEDLDQLLNPRIPSVVTPIVMNRWYYQYPLGILQGDNYTSPASTANHNCEGQSRSSSGSSQDSDKQLFIGSIPPNLTDNDIKGIFMKYGAISALRIKRNGPGLHFGFITFEEESAAQAVLFDRPITLPDNPSIKLTIEDKKRRTVGRS